MSVENDQFYAFLVASLGLLAIVIVIGLLSIRVINKRKFMLWALLVEYLFLVVCATVVCRQPLPKPHLQLSPLWVYTDFLHTHQKEAVKDIVVNLLLFLPIGALLDGLYPSLKWYQALLIGLACSLTIEVAQYAFMRGIAQTDDVIHNAGSCLVGWGGTRMVVGRSRLN